MGDDLKSQWGVDAPKPPPSDKQAKAFKAAFSAKVSPIAGHLAYTKAHAEPSAHDPVQKRRDELDTAYQSAAAQIDPSDEAKGKAAIDQTLAQAGTLAGEVAAFRKKIEGEYNAWMKAKPAYDKAVKQVEELEAWDAGPAVKPRDASCAASKPASAARPACSGLDIESIRNACCRPAAKVAAVASACANWISDRPSRSPAAAAAPKVPTVPVLCQYL